MHQRVLLHKACLHEGGLPRLFSSLPLLLASSSHYKETETQAERPSLPSTVGSVFA